MYGSIFWFYFTIFQCIPMLHYCNIASTCYHTFYQAKSTRILSTMTLIPTIVTNTPSISSMSPLASMLSLSTTPIDSKLSIVSWNINGLRSLLKHDNDQTVLNSLIERRNVDILCLQETKLQEIHTSEIETILKSQIKAKKVYWSSSKARKGYSGTATIILNSNCDGILLSDRIGEPEGDLEGRTITLLHDKFILINVYTPNAGEALKRLDYRTTIWDIKFSEYISKLRIEYPLKPVIVVGDFNVAHTSLDYFNYKNPQSKRQAGTTPQEQTSFYENLLIKANLQDIYRDWHPEERKYSYFSPRKGEIGRVNKEGWRLDYVLVNFPVPSNHHENQGKPPTSWRDRLECPPFIEDDVSYALDDSWLWKHLYCLFCLSCI